MPRPLTGSISENKRLERLEVRRRKWLLPILVRTSIPVPVTRKRLAVALWVLILYFPTVGLRGTANLLSHKIPRILLTSADVNKNRTLDYNSAMSLFLLRHLGWCQNHEHGASFKGWGLLDGRYVCQRLLRLLSNHSTQFLGN